MYQRFVCFKFKEDTPPDNIQKHLEMFAALPGSIPQILTYNGGKVFDGGEGTGKYDTAHYVTYATREDIDIYFHHLAQQDFIEANKANWEDVLVVDREIISI
jgi:hypothetical protein